ncbi:MAG: hypothetical protein JXR36_09330 [Bacteroidales bacterium]|nr:hypothetical protein [Bacteroidales bacterium]
MFFLNTKYFSLFLIITMSFLLSACSKDEYGNKKTCFTFAQVGNRWTYEKIRVEYMNMDTIPPDTVFCEIINSGNNIYKFSPDLWGYTNFYIEKEFGGVRSFSPLTIDVIVKCNSKKGDIYPLSIENLNGTPLIAREVTSVDYQIEFNNLVLECYEVKYVNIDMTHTFYINKKYGIIKYRETTCPGGVGCYSVTYNLIDVNF